MSCKHICRDLMVLRATLPQVIILLHVLLYFFDGLPLALVGFSIACHGVYLQNFTTNWPVVSLTSPSFLASCALVIIDHFAWFFHFARLTQDARHRSRNPYGPKIEVPGFADIATFFGLCVWLVPLFLFLSLSAGDNTLPTNLSKPTCFYFRRTIMTLFNL